jgi:hypothetical protein
MRTRVSRLVTTRTDLYFALDDREYLGTERLHQFQQSLQTVYQKTYFLPISASFLCRTILRLTFQQLEALKRTIACVFLGEEFC